MGNNDICCFAMSCDDHDLDCKLLQLLREYSAPWSEETTSAAIYNANFQALKWCVSNGCPLDTSVNIENVVGQGNIEIMKWMRTQGFFFDKDTCASAAYGNNLEVLRWLRSEGYSLDDHTFFNAVSSGDLDMIQFCIDNDIPFDEELYVGAISNNDDPINTIKLLRSNGYPWHPSACARAVVECDLKLLLWLRCNGCPWDENVCNEAVEGDNLEILKYAHENGCPWSKETYARCFSEAGLDGEYEQIPTDHQCSDEIIGYLILNSTVAHVQIQVIGESLDVFDNVIILRTGV
ncbi:hypothetical protein CTEN210_09811 [Chaetoceros tenuissimus]|uniref:Ankyrin repeat-containing domain n=1 Tax=Chaetoceros tenuissimus TaxID=426638 RepID=A0AAD3CYN7_9STRA|nr:hypothetical protein CTEN210_09811 [Chaetoceros tenuissimus]